MGQNEYRLRALSNAQLLTGISSVVKRRNQVTAEFLAYLAEVDERRLYLDFGFGSLFEYCLSALRLCESTAGRHIAAARVCRDHPRVFAWVASGELHASALSLLRKHLTSENAAELFEHCRGQSARQVEELLAARFPRPDVRDLVRRLPARVGITPDERALEYDGGRLPEKVGALQCAQQPAKQSCESLPNEQTHTSAATAATAATAAPSVAIMAPESAKSRRIEPLSADRYGVHFTADGEFCQLLERVRGLAGHRLPSGDLMTLLKRGLEAYERELQRERFGVGRKPRGSSSAEAASGSHSNAEISLRKIGKTIPAAVALTSAKPSAAKPTSTELKSTELKSTEPTSTEPTSTKSKSTEPTAVEPTSTEPTAADRHNSDPQRDPQTSTRAKWARRCPVAVAREVFVRDGGRCSFVATDGRRCGARRRLELDHIVPRARGGEHSVSNLRLRCRSHNQHYARRCFGAAYMRAAVQYARKRRSRESAGCG